MIRVKRVYEEPAKEDGYRILVDRLWPRGLTKVRARVDFWMKEIAPSDALRRWYGHEPERWPEFEKRYRAELAKKKELLAEIERLEKEYGKVTLLFGRKDEKQNQAVVLAGRIASGPTGDEACPGLATGRRSSLFWGWLLRRMEEIGRGASLPVTARAIFCIRLCIVPALRISLLPCAGTMDCA
jgi:uncharacterized protein YeaO (DUF488 family)